MEGAFGVLLISIVLYAFTLLVHRFIEGSWVVVRLPDTWFYASWLIGLTILTLPIFKYSESFNGITATYLIAVLSVFSLGGIAAAFWGKEVASSWAKNKRRIEPVKIERYSVGLLYFLLVIGVIGTTLLTINSVLSGTLSLSERFDSSNFSALRAEHMLAQESRIGPLYGPAGVMSAFGSLAIAYIYFLKGSRDVCVLKSRWLDRLSTIVLLLNFVAGFIAFGSRTFSVFGLVVAFCGFSEGRWAIGERLIVRRLSIREFIAIAGATVAVLVALWISATVFLQYRVQNQDPMRVMYTTHRAVLHPFSSEIVRDDKALEYFMLSLSYLSTPIPTLVFYLDLPENRQPGPFLGEYEFPALWRWGRRLTFNVDPLSWENARLDLFKPLGDIGFGTNVFATMARDLMADFTKIGALIFLGFLGFISQRVYDKQRNMPTMRRAGLLIYIRMLLAASGFFSFLFQPQFHWPLYLSIVLACFPGLFLGDKINKRNPVGVGLQN